MAPAASASRPHVHNAASCPAAPARRQASTPPAPTEPPQAAYRYYVYSAFLSALQPTMGARLLKTDTTEHLKPRSQYSEDAVQLAIQGKWDEAVKLNPMNSIAKKNAARINALLHQKEGLKVGGTRVDLNLFVEEMGKTVITNVESPGSADISSKVAAGDVAELKVDGDSIVVETSRGVKLGSLE